MVMTDHIAGLIAAQCIGFALYRRERTGVGEAVEVPMFENMASFVASEHLGAATFEPPLGPAGDERLLSPYYRPLPTKDGFITAHPNDNRQAFAFFAAIGRPELRDDPRFNTPKARSENAAAFFELRAEALREKTTVEWLDIFAAADVPAARYNRIEDLLEDPHLAEVGFWEEDDHPTEGRIRRTRVANRFSGGMREDTLPAPRLGQHTREVLAELGYSAAEIARMVETGAAVDRHRTETV
jgi:crotonobetainyl-CoA:carnitine CoA-transferase CaiB-like acyl-CoA transferase